MRFELIAALCFCFVLQCQGQRGRDIFNNFFERAPSELCNPRCHEHGHCRGLHRYYCTCDEGYEGNGYRCRDVNECKQNPSPCKNSRTNTKCVNLEGTYRCDAPSCRPGYQRSSSTGRCRDVNECARTRGICGKGGRCINHSGSYSCTCRRGYVQSNRGTCRPAIVTRPTTTTTTTTTTRTPSMGTDANYCNGNLRIWSECRGNPLVRVARDNCKPRFQNCSDGVLLGELFTKNFLGPATERSSSSNSNAPTNSRTLSISTSNAGAPPPPGSNNQFCVVQNITNANGDVIAGSCVPTSSSAGTGSRTKRFATPRHTRRDLLIMFDESGSVGRSRYEKVKRIAAAIVRLLCGQIRLHPSYTRVAIMSFNRRTYFHVPLLSTGSKQFLNSDPDRLAKYIINNIYYHGGYQARRTCLVKALQQAYNTALDQSTGGRPDSYNVEQDIIVISDGCENCIPRYNRENKIEEMTRFFIRNHVHVYVIGIGLSNQCKESLSILAQGGRCYHFFYLSQWDLDVDEFLFQLEHPPRGICLSVLENPTRQCISS